MVLETSATAKYLPGIAVTKEKDDLIKCIPLIEISQDSFRYLPEYPNSDLRHKQFLEINYGVKTRNFKINETNRDCY